MIYLDNAATTRPLAEGLYEAVCGFDNFFNPAALYRPAVETEGVLQQARKTFADCLGVEKGIFFTSGGTESNNIAIQGVFKNQRNRRRHYITSMTEHAAVYQTFRYLETLGAQVDYLLPDAHGVVHVEDVERCLRPDTVMVSIMHVNNEVGAINDIAEIAQRVKRMNPRTLVHSDGVQAFGKIKEKLDPCVDLYAISGHKLNAPKGIGALYIRPGTKLDPLFYGGGQQGGIRPGTENPPLALAFALAAEMHYGDDRCIEIIRQCKAELKRGILDIPGACINSGPDGVSAPHILSASFPGVPGETIQHMLEAKEIYVGTGSACSAGEKDNRVLSSMGLSRTCQESALRFSLSYENTIEEIRYATQEVRAAYEALETNRRKMFR